MLELRLSPDDIARTKPADINDLAYAKARGMNLFTVANFVPPSKNPNACWTCVASPEECFNPAFYDEFVARFKPYVEELRRRGWLKDAFLGVFRADFAPDGKLVDWCSVTPHGSGEPDFHRPCHFFKVNMR